jgi:hypothetical protein
MGVGEKMASENLSHDCPDRGSRDRETTLNVSFAVAGCNTILL